MGAKVIATTSSEEKAEKLKALGADEIINYKEHPKWGEKVLELTDNEGVDHVVEVGGGQTFNESIRAVKLCLLYTSPSPRDATLSRMPSSA